MNQNGTAVADHIDSDLARSWQALQEERRTRDALWRPMDDKKVAGDARRRALDARCEQLDRAHAAVAK